MAVPSRNIPTVRSGDAITAEAFNALADAVSRMARIRQGPGVLVRTVADGVVIGLDLEFFKGFPLVGRITAVAGGAGPGIASTFTYSVKVRGRPELPTYTGITPSEGRPVLDSDSTTQIYPAVVGDMCLVELRPDGDGTSTARMCVLTEVLALEDCAAAVSDAQSLGLGVLLDEVLIGIGLLPVIGIDTELATTNAVNDAQIAAYISPVVIGIDMEPVVGTDGTVVLAAEADDAAEALWSCAIIDHDGHLAIGIDGHIALAAESDA